MPPVFDDLEVWLAMQLASISGKPPLAAAIRYALKRMERLRPYLHNGMLELDNNVAERGMRAIAYTLIETAKLNGTDPFTWLAGTIARIISTTKSTGATICYCRNGNGNL